MQNLLEFLSKNFHWLLFVLLETVSVSLLFSYNNYQGSVWFSSANAVSGQLFEWTSGITSYFSLSTKNKELVQENANLQLQLVSAKSTIARLSKDSTALMTQFPVAYRTISAEVVQSSLDEVNNFITINKGEADGVRKDMGVISGKGVVGIVYLAGSHYSIVLPILNSQSNISCTIRNRGYFGYLRWSGNDSDYAYMEDVPRHAHFAKGDIIETSGYSSVFPRGINVGKVVCTFNSADGLSFRIKVRLATDFSNLRDVCIIDNTPMQEKIDILRAAQDSIAGRPE